LVVALDALLPIAEPHALILHLLRSEISLGGVARFAFLAAIRRARILFAVSVFARVFREASISLLLQGARRRLLLLVVAFRDVPRGLIAPVGFLAGTRFLLRAVVAFLSIADRFLAQAGFLDEVLDL